MSNGQVEHANGMILQGLKPRIYNDLNKFGKQWMKELPSVVWSLRTTPSRATGFTLFFLVYGAEAVLPTDLEYGSPRTRTRQALAWGRSLPLPRFETRCIREREDMVAFRGGHPPFKGDYLYLCP
jgi:hypothetical protein